MLFVTAKSTSRYLWLFALLRLGSASDKSNQSREQSLKNQSVGSSFLSKTTTHTQMESPTYARLQRRRSAIQKETCTVLPQPLNGVRRKHKEYCSYSNYIRDCNIVEGVEFPHGAMLNYSCDAGYEISGNSNVLCDRLGNWSPIPVCIAAECESPITLSTTGRCFREGQWMNCFPPLLPGTRARLSCRPGYRPVTTSTNNEGETVECKVDGKWEPDPIHCVPVCGRVTNETGANTRDFPWHASVYHQYADRDDPKGGDAKNFICSATIIQPNLVLIAAHCIHDESTNRTTNPSTLFVMAGHSIENWNDALNDPNSVHKTAVRNVYVNCDFWGVDGRSEADIALLEIEQPFQFSELLVPACLDDFQYNEQGRGSETWKTYSTGSKVIRILSIKTIPYTECMSSGDVNSDKFCSDDSKIIPESSVCVQISGGGLMLEKNGSWYVTGILSKMSHINFVNHNNTCNHYSVYTKVSEYMAWIKDVIFNLERHKAQPPCDRDWSSTTTTTMTTVARTSTEFSNVHQILPSTEDTFCSAPSQPANGEWKYHQSSCTDNGDCKILQGARLRPGSHLVYSCAFGYTLLGTTQVYCGSDGKWSTIPVCVAIKCEPLNSSSRTASCSGRFGEYVSCDSPVPPGTWAKISCPPAFKMEASFATNRRELVQCKDNGRWLPDPIRCSPVCGVAITYQTPLVINGTLANIGDFPWHATLYRQTISPKLGIRKDFICGATIIQTNFILTAAHCVYDEVTRTTDDPKRLFVVTGNTFSDYDSPFHNPITVKKSAVKNVYRPCEYYGFRGNYVSDIALLELQEPFKLSSVLLPACLDVSGHTKQILEPGAYGRVAGFGRTATGESSRVLQTLELPYISYNQCKNASSFGDSDVFISNDKFCAGFTTGSAVCEGDSGGGLVFKKGDLWYVLGIVSVGLGVNLDNGERTCDRYSYSLYTKVVEHITWIQEVMFQLAQNGFYKSCDIKV